LQQRPLGPTPDEGREPAAMTEPGDFKATKAVGRLSQKGGGDRHQVEAPLEERHRGPADQDAVRLGPEQQLVQDCPGFLLGLQVDLRRAADLAQREPPDVQRQLDPEPLDVPGLGARRRSLDRHGGQRSPSRRVLHRLDPEGRQDASGTQLLDPAPEAQELFDQDLEPPAAIRWEISFAELAGQCGPNQAEAAALPANPQGCRSGDDGVRLWLPTPSQGVGIRRAKTVLLQTVAEGVARHAQRRRGPQDVPSGPGQNFQQPLALGVPLQFGESRRRGGFRLLREPRGGAGQPESRGRHFRGLGEEGHPLDHVGQLAHVPGPGVREQRGPRLLREMLGRELVVGAGAGQEVLGQEQDVAPPLPQRWQPDREDGHPVVEVLSESALPRRREQILAGGGEDPGVHRLAAGTAESPHLALLDDLQELGLHPLGKEPDLVEEDRSLVSRLEESRLRVVSAGERAALEP
jgi:hypothetical protein